MDDYRDEEGGGRCRRGGKAKASEAKVARGYLRNEEGWADVEASRLTF